MSTTWLGGNPNRDKPQLKIIGKEVIVSDNQVYDASVSCTYNKKTVLTFSSEDKAKEYYYKNR